MTVEERLEQLESELAKLRGKPVVYATNAYAVARQNVNAHFLQVKQAGQNYGAQMYCEDIARKAFRETHGVTGRDKTPPRYIDTEEKAAEYFELFKTFLDVYQNYLGGITCENC